ncbi:PREDICTED: uncharacterized protein LOC104813722 isoform X2 [Tarenaya hassleriana]|uniref:uncharacterized protein LOC104813722 isoform X2 n=1 Tax=Tarenaya hassleriana TaxID=28532 RepID=UPI00053C6266|nr:PREDICTED: uncharacterized protein LOC104813722 isoform X2 [Tarenaya hassleriana]
MPFRFVFSHLFIILSEIMGLLFLLCRNSENVVSQNVLDASLPRFPSYRTPIVPIEKRLSHQASSVSETPKSPEKLRDEIASLEFEILRLERYLLSLYRTAFDAQVPSLSGLTGTNLPNDLAGSPSVSLAKQFSHKFDQRPEPVTGFGYRYQASPSYNNPFSYPRGFPGTLKALSAREGRKQVSGNRRLGDLLGASHIIENIVNPNKLSEDIVRCICSVYYTLSGCSRTDSGFSYSPPSSLSSSSVFSSKAPYDNSLSLHCNEDNILNQRFADNQEADFSSAIVIETLKIHPDDGSFNYAALMLQNFRSLVQNLEKVDPSGMKREEKLAFWINIHNALVMHAYLAYGIHNRARNTVISKATYDVGGQRVNPYIIQSSILGIRPHYSVPKLQTLFSPSRKSKTCSIRHIYALEYPEPLVHFTLSSGASMEPPVRVYTADSIFRDLRQAKGEFIRNNVRTHKGTKILLPKIICYYMKDMSMDMSGFLEATTDCLPDGAKRIAQKCLKDKKNKHVEWLPENSDFRYVIAGELARGRTKR